MFSELTSFENAFAILLNVITYYIFTCALIYTCILFNLFFERNAVFYGKNILLVTAHPDDECMFFAPLIIELAKANSLHILCTTTGNYYQKGELRKEELYSSCKILGIPAHQVEIFDNKHFQDSPTTDSWDQDVLKDEILQHIKKVDANVILIFDGRGVSGHSNHIATGQVVREMVKDGSLQSSQHRVYELETVSLMRKYISFLDLPFTLATTTSFYVSSIPSIIQAQRAMLAHRSQLVWFRYLYIVFSRYMITNTIREVAA